MYCYDWLDCWCLEIDKRIIGIWNFRNIGVNIRIKTSAVPGETRYEYNSEWLIIPADSRWIFDYNPETPCEQLVGASNAGFSKRQPSTSEINHKCQTVEWILWYRFMRPFQPCILPSRDIRWSIKRILFDTYLLAVKTLIAINE